MTVFGVEIVEVSLLDTGWVGWGGFGEGVCIIIRFCYYI